MGLEVFGVGGAAGHHDFDCACVVGVGVPVGAEFNDLLVEIYADAAAHSNDHAFAVEGGEAVLEVLHDVLSHQKQPFLGAHHRLKLCPLAFEFVFGGLFFPFGHVFKVGVDSGLLGIIEGEFSETGFVVDFDGGFVFDGSLDIVDVDVVAKDLLGVFVYSFDGGSGEADERGVGQGIAQVFGKPIDFVGSLLPGFFIRPGDNPFVQAILGAVGFVGDEDDVVAIAQLLILAAPFVGGKFLDGGEDDATGGDLKFGFEVGAIAGLGGYLAQQIGTFRERTEELVVQVVAIGEDDQGGVG